MMTYPESIAYEPTDGGISVAARVEEPAPQAPSLLSWLIESQVILIEEWDELPARDRERVTELTETDEVLAALVQRHLLTRFQADQVRGGNGADLVLGQYRLLDMLGQGGMGTVYRAEHLQLRREVALKVMARTAAGNQRMVSRFYAEARAVARLQHPNIVTCFDAGRQQRPGPSPVCSDYFVMELIAGQDLFRLVREKGALSPHRVCDMFRQVAEALGEAHRHGLIHRDIKPSNILVTPDWQAKVLDFGLARMPQRNVTEPGTLLGTVGYMAPEQANDPRTVDGRADLFSLGASMYWALTCREPYPETGNPYIDLQRRMTTIPTPVRQLRPEIPAEVSDLVSRLMEQDPDQRYPSARSVAATLTGFSLWLPTAYQKSTANPDPSGIDPKRERVLLVDDDETIRALMGELLRDRYEVREAADAEVALGELVSNPPDLVVVDVNLPGLSGPEFIAKARSAGHDPDRVKVLLMSGNMPDEALGGLSVTGADDFLAKPFKAGEFVSRIRALMFRRSSTGSPEGGNPTLRISANATVRTTTPTPPPARSSAAVEALSQTVSRLMIETNLATEGHWGRIARYVRALAVTVVDKGEYARLKDDAFLDLLAGAAPVYDIGLLAIPRGLLMKQDRLDPDEQSIVQTHTTIGSDVLMGVAGRLAAELPSLPLAAELARSHHERWNGTGYPDQLAREEIPLSARVIAVVSMYEALRQRRPNRPALSHSNSIRIITTESPGQFDSILLAALTSAAPRFDQIHQAG